MIMMEGDLRDGDKGRLRKGAQWVAVGSTRKEQNTRGPRAHDANVGKVTCSKPGTCTRGAFFAMYNFAEGVIEHAENAHRCTFSFRKVDNVKIAITEKPNNSN